MSANRSPTRLGEPIDDDTTTTTPHTVMPIAIQVRRFVRSPKNTRPTTAAMIGDAATITTTFATSVRVIAVMKQTWLTPKGSRPWQAHGRGPGHADGIATLHHFLEGQLNGSEHRDKEGHRPTVDVGESDEIGIGGDQQHAERRKHQPRCRPSTRLVLAAQRLGEARKARPRWLISCLSSPISANVRPSPSAGTNTGS